jgi:hypothetical protein
VPALADQLGRLIGALHDNSPKTSGRCPCGPSLQKHANGAPGWATVGSGGLYGYARGASISVAGRIFKTTPDRSARPDAARRIIETHVAVARIAGDPRPNIS